MAQLTITANVSVTVDGLVTTQATSYIADVQSFDRSTRDVDDTVTQLGSAGTSFALIENIGDEAVFISMETSGGSRFFIMGIAPGSHIFIHGRHGDDSNGITVSQNISARSLTSAGSRIVIYRGTNWTQ